MSGARAGRTAAVLLAIASVSCSDDGDIAAVDTSTTIAPAPTTVPARPTMPIDVGREIGSGAIGPEIRNPQNWRVGTILADVEPGALVVGFVPPEPGCVAALATATIGRGGAILVSVFVDGDRIEGSDCVESAPSRRVIVPLSEALGGRRVYTSTLAATGGHSAAAEAVADEVIGLSLADGRRLAQSAGFTVRDLTGPCCEEDFDPGRITVEPVDGIIVFAEVG